MSTTTSPPDARERERQVLRRARHVLWGVVLFLHLGYSVAYAFEARYYVDTFSSLPYFTLLLKTFGRANNLNDQVCGAVLVTSAAISAWHLAAATTMLRVSWAHRSLMLRRRKSSVVAHAPPPSHSTCWRAWHMLTAPWRAVAWFWATYCGVDGVYFEFVTTLRESFEIATQTYVVYRLSKYVASPGINTLASLALVVNCWSTPVLRMWFAHSPRGPLVRTLVGTDIASVFTVLVPATVFAKYYALALAPVATRYDPQHFIDRGNLFQQIFTLTWTDWFSTRFAAVLAIASLETIKRKAQERRPRPSTRTTLKSVLPQRSSAKVGPDPMPSFATMRLLSHLSLFERTYRVSNALFLGMGVAVLILHVVASSHPPPLRETTPGVDCSLVLRPWLFPSSQCAVLSLNCHRLQIQGHQDEWDHVLPTANNFLHNLMAVRFSHCPFLEMPTQLREMKGLIQLIVFNATLASWGEEAAFTTKSHPILSSIAMIRVRNMRELPRGLLAPDFPAIVFETSDSDLEDLPANLAALWLQPMEVVSIERARLSHVPVALSQMKTGRLSLGGNRIQHAPATLFANHDYHRAVVFTNNPLTELPTQSVVNFKARNLGLIDTNVSVLPDWITAAARQPEATTPFVYADNSPLCHSNSKALKTLVECETPPDLLIWYAIPLDEITAANTP